jgi:hypothetical protein
MLVQCAADGTTFEAHEAPYPGEGRQTHLLSKDGDRVIECPTCARRYWFYDATGRWTADRDLKIVS